MAAGVSPDIIVALSDEDYVRLILIIKKIGLKCALCLFHLYFPKDPIQLYHSLLPYKNQLEPLFPDQRQILFGTPAQGSDINDYDLTLIFKILKLKKDPNAKALKALQEIRNWLAHYPSKTLPKSVYNQRFQDMKKILMKLGASSLDIDYFLTCQINISDDEKQKITQELLRDIREATAVPPNDLVLKDVLNIVCKEIRQEWRNLALSLRISVSVIDDIDKQVIGDDHKMNKCFESKSNNISWKELKNQLNKINRQDIVKKLIQETYLTTVLKQASSDLEELYKKTLSKVEDRDALENPTCSRYKYVPRQEAFVNLTLSDTRKFDNNIVNSDRMYNLNVQCDISKPIKLTDVMQNDDSFVVIRGVGGIGKTTLVDNIVLQWSKKEIFNGEFGQPDIKLVFHIKCRTLNGTDLDNLLEKQFPSIFSSISLADISELGDQVLILFDGLDELDEALAKMLHKIMLPNSIILKNSRICVTGRPNAIQDLLMDIKGSIIPKVIDVVGFTLDNINKYVENHFENHQERDERIARMKLKLIENSEFKSMASIPAYLWILCCLNDNKTGLDSADTVTNMCILASFIIIREHYKSLQLSDMDISGLSQNEKVLDLILQLAKLSFTSLNEKKVILNESDLGEQKDELMRTGFLVRYINDNIVSYQFRHLILSEFLSGLHIYLMEGEGLRLICAANQNSLLWNSLPTVTALSHSQKNSDRESVFHNFLAKMKRTYEKELTFYNRISNYVKSYRPVTIEQTIKKLFENMRAVNELIVINESWLPLLSSIYEYKEAVPQYLIHLITSGKAFICITINYYHQLRCVVYLSRYIPTGKPYSVSLSLNLDAETLNNDDLRDICILIVTFKNLATSYSLKTRLWEWLDIETSDEFLTSLKSDAKAYFMM